MSRRIRRGRKGIDLPLKDPPTSTDRLIGHDASGSMFQTPADAVAAAANYYSPRCRVDALGNVDQLPGRIPLTCTRVSTGLYNVTAPVGHTIFTATATPRRGSAATRTINLGGTPGRTIQVRTMAANAVLTDEGFTLHAEVVPD